MDARLSDKISEFEAIYNLQGIDDVKTAAIIESRAAGEKKIFFRLLYASGVAFSSSNMSYWQAIGIDRRAVKQLLSTRDMVFKTVSIRGRKDRVRIAYGIIGHSVVVQLGYSMENDIAFIEIFKGIFLITMSALIIMAVLVGWFMARRAVSGVEAVTRTAQQISESELGRRVPIMAQHEEIDHLAVTFNNMLDRIEKLVAGIREMGDNIAHDLKSPVARIRGMAEISLSGMAGDNPELLSLAGNTIEECDRLLDMINTMLMISKTDAGANNIDLEEVNIAEVARGAVVLFSPLAEDKGLTLSCNTPESLVIDGDLKMLQRTMANLVDNAIKYTPSPGRIGVHVSEDPDHVDRIEVCVTDTGIGIEESDLPKLFNRFFRCDQSRTTSGSGLGLSLAQTIAHAHHGEIRVTSSKNQGSVFTLSLPRRHAGATTTAPP